MVRLAVAITILSTATIISAAATGQTTTTSGPPSSVAAQSNQPNPFRVGHTLIIPHGGGDGLFPEDTLLAYEGSTALGGEVIDIDIQTSKDGVPVAIHDATLERTTNGKGNVTSFTAAQLAKLDAGYNFRANGRYPFRHRGIGVPTLEQVLRRYPKMLATLDLKDLSVAAVTPVCDVLRRLKRTENVYVGVDTDEQVVEFRRRCPEVRTSGTSAERKATRAARDANDETFVTHQLVGQPEYIAKDGTKRITAQYLAFAHAHGIAVLTWVVDDPKELRALIDLGVDGIYTRRPDVMAAVAKEHSAPS